MRYGLGFHSMMKGGTDINGKLVVIKMAEITPIQDNAKSMTKLEKYELALLQIEALLKDESDLIANMANISAYLKEAFSFFWVGFYRVDEDELVLGPFQGPVACTRLPKAKGVCWSSVINKETVIVPNVDEFPGHIACASESKSEIVIPILKGQDVHYVLDVDSEHLDHFNETDRAYLEKISLLL